VLEAFARGLANKLLHHPMQALSHATDGDRDGLARAVRALFPEADEDGEPKP
jgi:glutamyl-tRNA reductase